MGPASRRGVGVILRLPHAYDEYAFLVIQQGLALAKGLVSNWLRGELVMRTSRPMVCNRTPPFLSAVPQVGIFWPQPLSHIWRRIPLQRPGAPLSRAELGLGCLVRRVSGWYWEEGTGHFLLHSCCVRGGAFYASGRCLPELWGRPIVLGVCLWYLLLAHSAPGPGCAIFRLPAHPIQRLLIRVGGQQSQKVTGS